MSAARDRIFGAIRKALGPRDVTPAAIAAEAAALVANRAAIQPDFGDAHLVDRFLMKATSERVTATVARVAELADVPGAVRDYIEEMQLAARAAVQPHIDLRALDWTGIEIVDTPGIDGGLAVTVAEHGVAETGSVVFRSGRDAPVLLNFLPLHHLVVLRVADILAYAEDLWPHLGGSAAPQSRLLTMVTGTSGTADIEAKNIRGAHGPRYLRIVLIG